MILYSFFDLAGRAFLFVIAQKEIKNASPLQSLVNI